MNDRSQAQKLELLLLREQHNHRDTKHGEEQRGEERREKGEEREFLLLREHQAHWTTKQREDRERRGEKRIK